MRGRRWTPQIGERFDRLVIVDTSLRAAPTRQGRAGQRRFRCRCDCGRYVILDPAALRAGYSRSCGCLRREVGVGRGAASRTHGLAAHPLYKTWAGMLARCHDPSNKAYSRYGGRGIAVYPLWRDSPTPFIQWVEHVLGPRPLGHSLDRVDNDGCYEPGNLRWADWITQNNNRRPASRTRWSCEGA